MVSTDLVRRNKGSGPGLVDIHGPCSTHNRRGGGGLKDEGEDVKERRKTRKIKRRRRWRRVGEEKG